MFEPLQSGGMPCPTEGGDEGEWAGGTVEEGAGAMAEEAAEMGEEVNPQTIAWRITQSRVLGVADMLIHPVDWRSRSLSPRIIYILCPHSLHHAAMLFEAALQLCA